MQNLKDAGSCVKEAEVVLSVLVGLPSPYAMAMEVLQMSDDISFQKPLPKVLQVEQHVRQLEAGISVPVYGAMHRNVKKYHCCGKP